jgi:hypothetical protein
MALIVETGGGLATANSYCDVAYADAYHTGIANADWAGDTTTKEQALIVACQSLDLLYGPRFVSAREEGEQALLWPRYPFIDRNGNTRTTGIPVELKKAQAELALMYLLGANLFPEGNSVLDVQSETVKVGEISTSTTYVNSGRTEMATFDGFRKVELILWPLMKGRQSIVRFSR